MFITQGTSVIPPIDVLWTPNDQTGFLPRRVPTTPLELASSANESLSALGSISPKLGIMRDSEIEDFVAGLASEPDVLPEAHSPEFCEAATRAYVNLAAHLIHRPAFAHRKQLPRAVARPLWSFSEYVNRPPSLTYASYVLANFTSPVPPRCSADTLQIAQTPSGTPDEEWFVAVHLCVESAGGEVVRAIDLIDHALEEGSDSELVKALEIVESCMCFANSTMPLVREHLDPTTFRNAIRPLLYGHDKICFEGVEGNPTITYIGETGAQSGIIRAVDSVLGVVHSEAIATSMNRFLICAPKVHQRFFEQTRLLGLRLAASGRARVARQAALRALTTFRRTHLEVVSEYLAPAGKPLAEVGTGGTHFSVWLRRLIEETDRTATEG